MKLSTKLGLMIIIVSVSVQIIAESFYTERMMWRFVVQSMIISWIAAVSVWYGYRSLERETTKAKSRLMDELGITEDDLKIFTTNIVPLLREFKKVDINKATRLSKVLVKKLDKINIDEFEATEWLSTIDDEEELITEAQSER